MAGIFCAIDTPDLTKALTLCAALAPLPIDVKLGLEFFCAQGPEGIRAIRAAHQNKRLFLDLKLHDIPNTVASALRAVAALPVDYVTVHAAGGAAMLKMAQEENEKICTRLGRAPLKILAVTVLTHLDAADCTEIGWTATPSEQVLRLAKLAAISHLHGIVCAGSDLQNIKQHFGSQLHLVTPGIRPEGAASQDQKRVLTPREAIHLGANDLVIGRPITAATDPRSAAQEILSVLT